MENIAGLLIVVGLILAVLPVVVLFGRGIEDGAALCVVVLLVASFGMLMGGSWLLPIGGVMVMPIAGFNWTLAFLVACLAPGRHVAKKHAELVAAMRGQPAATVPSPPISAGSAIPRSFLPKPVAGDRVAFRELETGTQFAFPTDRNDVFVKVDSKTYRGMNQSGMIRIGDLTVPVFVVGV